MRVHPTLHCFEKWILIKILLQIILKNGVFLGIVFVTFVAKPIQAQSLTLFSSTNRQSRIDRVYWIRTELARLDKLSTSEFEREDYVAKIGKLTRNSTTQLSSKSMVGSDWLSSKMFKDVRSQSLYREMTNLESVVYDREGLTDNRLDANRITNSLIQTQMLSVAAMIDSARVKTNENGTITLLTTSLSRQFGLCEDEHFTKQPTIAYGTSFLIGTQIMATAGHCVGTNTAPPLERILIIFGYRMKSETSAQLSIPLSDVYSVRRVVQKHFTLKAADWAILELDRPCSRPVLGLRQKGVISDNSPVYIIGYPCGLPVKYADGARVTINLSNECFSATLDAYGGNSGSPVFGTNHLVEGILVRGKPDFEPLTLSPGQCRRSHIWPDTGADGEDCTRISSILDWIPKFN